MGDRVLVVDDDPLTADAVAFALREDGFDVAVAGDGAAALEWARARKPAAVVLDVGLPGISGMDVCRTLRGESAVPILMLTARDKEVDTVLALDRGADDYVTKPFALAEVVARVRALVRGRALARAGQTPVVEVGDLRLDVSRHEITVDESPVQATPSEFRLLTLLAERAGEAVTRAELCTWLWGTDRSLDTRACDLHVSRLRQKIEDDPTRPRRLVTVRGIGYRLVAG